MTISSAQINILKLAHSHNDIFQPSLSPLRGSPLKNVINALLKRGLLAPETPQGYPITPTGFAALGVKPAKPTPLTARKGTKIDKLIKLLKRKNGATNAQIQAALKWQAHSVRGVISGTLKKKMGFNVTTTKKKSGKLAYAISD